MSSTEGTLAEGTHLESGRAQARSGSVIRAVGVQQRTQHMTVFGSNAVERPIALRNHAGTLQHVGDAVCHYFAISTRDGNCRLSSQPDMILHYAFGA